MKFILAHPPCGPVRGQLDGTVSRFLGIPYAAAPVGELRWRPPVPLQAWSDVRDALAFGADCPQPPDPASQAPRQDEDCLHINVWAPADAQPGTLPVMVWVHGGGFIGGSGAHAASDGARLAAQGVVVVSFNYRVGLFGFLSHPALSAQAPGGTSGNYGLLDQVAALRWVQAHIGAFGGDPARVTAFGVSAGSASISLLLASPLGRGLFHRAILQSPGAGRPLARLAQAEAAGLAVGTDLAELRTLPADALLARTHLVAPAVRALTTARMLRPVVDGWLVPQDERDGLKAGKLSAMPLIVGTNADEGSWLTWNWPADTVAAYEQQVGSNFAGVQDQVRSLYPVHGDADARPRIAEMLADTQFNYGAWLLAQAMARRGAPTWRYVFTRRAAGAPDGPHHSVEVPYVFGNLGQVPGADAQDRVVSDTMRKAWVAFARGADPGADGLAWARYDPALDNHLEFADSPRAGAGWRQRYVAFLDGYFGEPLRFASGG
ncbi:carboxylesterase/lipase family protein [Ramlibacter sp. Leaf400]|uniref:carboxylesterase/lipase family protein n=1 Tax=Ramlibacter sp. Leaf400 TaxID=1736365 RepID=UPI0006F31770|nr:carboxylesterase family protein [Ramlibacter sp. Leaf400]KQT11399.1 hypothetical protein ASG30_05870 [Ramlibacter sp. Leaf400]